jgi:hypothetical protein
MIRATVVILLLVGCASEGPRQGIAACTHFGNVMQDVADGVLSDDEIRTKIQEVERHADADR